MTGQAWLFMLGISALLYTVRDFKKLHIPQWAPLLTYGASMALWVLSVMVK